MNTITLQSLRSQSWSCCSRKKGATLLADNLEELMNTYLSELQAFTR